VVVCHRPPRQAVASYASLIHTLRQAYSDSASPATAGRQALERAATAMRRAMRVRDAATGTTFVDVAYRGLVRDPVGAVRAVYARLGRQLDAGVDQRMRAWALAHPQHAHGAHRYDLDRFDLSGGDVDAAFEPYMERFGEVAGG
jgi:LPS sulfotransferase NodH